MTLCLLASQSSSSNELAQVKLDTRLAETASKLRDTTIDGKGQEVGSKEHGQRAAKERRACELQSACARTFDLRMSR